MGVVRETEIMEGEEERERVDSKVRGGGYPASQREKEREGCSSAKENVGMWRDDERVKRTNYVDAGETRRYPSGRET